MTDALRSIRKYVLGGVLLGLVLLLAASLAGMYGTASTVHPPTLLVQHPQSLVRWLVGSAPLWCGLLAALVGWRHEQLKRVHASIEALNAQLAEHAHRQERTDALIRALNEEPAASEHAELWGSVCRCDELGLALVDITKEGALHIASLNPACERLLGLSADEVYGEPFSRIAAEASAQAVTRMEAKHRQCLDAGTSLRYEEDMPAGGEEARWTVQLTPLRDCDGGIHRILSIALPGAELHDDPRRHALSSTLRHELRTPLTSIAGSLRLASSGAVGAVPEQVQQMLEIAHRNSERLVDVVNDTLGAQEGGTKEPAAQLPEVDREDEIMEASAAGHARVALPVDKDEALQERREKLLILHVEDDADAAQVTAAMLGDLGEVVQAMNLQEAKACLQGLNFDVTILDVQLPDGNGLDLMPELQARDTHVIVYSGKETDVSNLEAVKAALVKSRASEEELRHVVRAAA